jgi:tRNA-specific 2-thiouridylase
MKIAVAMSGGVDSSVAAALLKNEGHDVFGITMLVIPENEVIGNHISEIASGVADTLGIAHYTVDLRRVFADRIISQFCAQYAQGRTPNPCVQCNHHIKFGVLYDKAKELGAEALATGHYARIEQRAIDGRFVLKKGIDRRRDQSYFLYGLSQEQLSHAVFPLGNMTKDKVREIASRIKLPVTSSESREICFIPDNNYSRFLRKYSASGTEPGYIKDLKGNVLGKHRGIINYTIGQRKRLDISAKQPLYVLAIDDKSNTVIVGQQTDIYSEHCTATDMKWIAVSALSDTMKVKTKIRYKHPETEAMVIPEKGGKVRIKFTEPQMAVTLGQSVVFYNGDVVVGGGIIEEAVVRYIKGVNEVGS